MKIGIGIALMALMNFIIFYIIDIGNIVMKMGDIFALQIFLGILIFILELMYDVNCVKSAPEVKDE